MSEGHPDQPHHGQPVEDDNAPSPSTGAKLVKKLSGNFKKSILRSNSSSSSQSSEVSQSPDPRLLPLTPASPSPAPAAPEEKKVPGQKHTRRMSCPSNTITPKSSKSTPSSPSPALSPSSSSSSASPPSSFASSSNTPVAFKTAHPEGRGDERQDNEDKGTKHNKNWIASGLNRSLDFDRPLIHHPLPSENSISPSQPQALSPVSPVAPSTRSRSGTLTGLHRIHPMPLDDSLATTSLSAQKATSTSTSSPSSSSTASPVKPLALLQRASSEENMCSPRGRRHTTVVTPTVSLFNLAPSRPRLPLNIPPSPEPNPSDILAADSQQPVAPLLTREMSPARDNSPDSRPSEKTPPRKPQGTFSSSSSSSSPSPALAGKRIRPGSEGPSSSSKPFASTSSLLSRPLPTLPPQPQTETEEKALSTTTTTPLSPSSSSSSPASPTSLTKSEGAGAVVVHPLHPLHHQTHPPPSTNAPPPPPKNLVKPPMRPLSARPPPPKRSLQGNQADSSPSFNFPSLDPPSAPSSPAIPLSASTPSSSTSSPSSLLHHHPLPSSIPPPIVPLHSSTPSSIPAPLFSASSLPPPPSPLASITKTETKPAPEQAIPLKDPEEIHKEAAQVAVVEGDLKHQHDLPQEAALKPERKENQIETEGQQTEKLRGVKRNSVESGSGKEDDLQQTDSHVRDQQDPDHVQPSQDSSTESSSSSSPSNEDKDKEKTQRLNSVISPRRPPRETPVNPEANTVFTLETETADPHHPHPQQHHPVPAPHEQHPRPLTQILAGPHKPLKKVPPRPTISAPSSPNLIASTPSTPLSTPISEAPEPKAVIPQGLSERPPPPPPPPASKKPSMSKSAAISPSSSSSSTSSPSLQGAINTIPLRPNPTLMQNNPRYKSLPQSTSSASPSTISSSSLSKVSNCNSLVHTLTPPPSEMQTHTQHFQQQILGDSGLSETDTPLSTSENPQAHPPSSSSAAPSIPKAPKNLLLPPPPPPKKRLMAQKPMTTSSKLIESVRSNDFQALLQQMGGSSASLTSSSSSSSPYSSSAPLTKSTPSLPATEDDSDDSDDENSSSSSSSSSSTSSSGQMSVKMHLPRSETFSKATSDWAELETQIMSTPKQLERASTDSASYSNTRQLRMPQRNSFIDQERKKFMEVSGNTESSSSLSTSAEGENRIANLRRLLLSQNISLLYPTPAGPTAVPTKSTERTPLAATTSSSANTSSGSLSTPISPVSVRPKDKDKEKDKDPDRKRLSSNYAQEFKSVIKVDDSSSSSSSSSGPSLPIISVPEGDAKKDKKKDKAEKERENKKEKDKDKDKEKDKRGKSKERSRTILKGRIGLRKGKTHTITSFISTSEVSTEQLANATRILLGYCATKAPTVQEYLQNIRNNTTLRKKYGDEAVNDNFTSLFEEEENDSNVIYDTQAEKDSNGEPQVYGATLFKLIQHLTSHKFSPDDSLLSVFLFTFRAFISPLELFELLIFRFYATLPSNPPIDWFDSHVIPVRQHIFGFLTIWIDKFFRHDFADNEAMMSMLAHFVIWSATCPEISTHHEVLMNSFTVQLLHKDFGTKKSKAPKSHTPQKNGNLLLTDLHPTEVARQLTLMEQKTYCKVSPSECIKQSWAKEDKLTKSPNVYALIEQFNYISSWVASTIVQVTDEQQRAVILNRFVIVAEECRAMKNFNAVMEILAGLQSAPIYRLKQTWSLLPSKTWDIWENLNNLMSNEENYSFYRSAVNNSRPPCIPYIGIYLTDFVFVEDGNSDYLPENEKLINITKLRFTASIMFSIYRCQAEQYNFQVVPSIQAFLLSLTTFDEKQLRELSLLREPRR